MASISGPQLLSGKGKDKVNGEETEVDEDASVAARPSDENGTRPHNRLPGAIPQHVHNLSRAATHIRSCSYFRILLLGTPKRHR